jgi:raffinose/stachyose/melibiose transport system permease protein
VSASTTTTGLPRPRRRPRPSKLLRVPVLTLVTLVMVGVPFWTLLVNSAKPLAEANQLGLGLPRTWALAQNYSAVFREGKLGSALVNTIALALPSILITLLISSMGAWVFARRTERRISMVYFYTIAAILLPPIIVTTVYVIRELHLYGTYWGAILFYCGILSPVSIFLMTGFVRSLPHELEDAARVDGAGPWRIYWHVVLPLLRPILLTTSVFLVLIVWNDLLYQFFLIGGQGKDTLSLSLYNFVQIRQYELAWNLIFADVVLVNVPILVAYFLVQRRLLAGLVSGALNQ